MSKNKLTKEELKRIKTGRGLLDYAVGQGCNMRSNGRHKYVFAPWNGEGCPVPDHPGDLPKGTQLSVIKRFMVMGITAAVAAGAWLLLF